eukprot:Pgem_evm1s2954
MLTFPSEKGQVDCVKELILANADVNDYELIKAKADVDKVNFIEKVTPLQTAARNGHVECLNELINAKADINKCFIDDITLFFYQPHMYTVN